MKHCVCGEGTKDPYGFMQDGYDADDSDFELEDDETYDAHHKGNICKSLCSQVKGSYRYYEDSDEEPSSLIEVTTTDTESTTSEDTSTSGDEPPALVTNEEIQAMIQVRTLKKQSIKT